MLNQLLPQRVDNTYHGHRLALWLFSLLLLMKIGMNLGAIFNGHTVASSADGIPLDTFTPAGARAVLSLLALLGLSHVMVALLCILVLVRYRALIPLMFLFLLVEHLSRRVIFQVMPIARVGKTPGFAINLVLFALEVGGLTLSLWKAGDTPPIAAEPERASG